MVSNLPTSRYQSENDLRALRKAIGWQSLGYDSKMRHRMLSLAQPVNFVYFSAYALARLVPSFSSFFLCYWSTMGFIFNNCHHTPLCWWRPLPTSVRCLWGAAVGAPISMVPCAAPNEQAATSPRQLLLLAPDEGFIKVPCRPQSW
jgi:hypothetical protein